MSSTTHPGGGRNGDNDTSCGCTYVGGVLSAPAAAAGLALPLCSEKPSAPTPHTGLVVSSEPPGGVDGAGEK